MKSKRKFASLLALLFALTVLLIFQPLAALDISPGVPIQGELGDANDKITTNGAHYDEYTFSAQSGQSYQITVVSNDLAMSSSIYLNSDTWQWVQVNKPSYTAQYSGIFKESGTKTIHVAATWWNVVAQVGKYTLNLEVGTPPEAPSAGVWSGSFVAFNVSADGSKITWEGSNLLNSQDEPIALKVGPITGNGGCKDFILTAWYKTNIPIADGNFAYSPNEELTMSGTFTSETTSEGQLSAEYDGGAACSGKFQKSGSWTAQKSSSSARSRLSTNATMPPADVVYEYNEAGELTAIKVYDHVSVED